jgi:hypothetical protein
LRKPYNSVNYCVIEVFIQPASAFRGALAREGELERKMLKQKYSAAGYLKSSLQNKSSEKM